MAKRLELVVELVPQAKLVSFLGNPNSPISEAQRRELHDAVIAKGMPPVVAVKASNPSEISEAFANLVQQKVDAIIVEADSYFQSQRELIVTLAARYALPTMYHSREYVAAGRSGELRYIDTRYLSPSRGLLGTNPKRGQAGRSSGTATN